MRLTLPLLLAALFLTGCMKTAPETLPGVDPRGTGVDPLIVGHRLLSNGEPELALRTFSRAGAVHGLTPEILAGIGTANLALGRLGQAETVLRRAVKTEGAWPELWNNLGVVLMERGKEAEAAGVLRRAYALDNGESDAIRDNLRLALAKIENPLYGEEQNSAYKLVRRGSSDYFLRPAN